MIRHRRSLESRPDALEVLFGLVRVVEEEDENDGDDGGDDDDDGAAGQSSKDNNEILTVHLLAEINKGDIGVHVAVFIRVDCLVLERCGVWFCGADLWDMLTRRKKRMIDMNSTVTRSNFSQTRVKVLMGIFEGLSSTSSDYRKGGELMCHVISRMREIPTAVFDDLILKVLLYSAEKPLGSWK